MSQTVTLEDGSVHSFPDDATAEEMQSALETPGGASGAWNPGQAGASGAWSAPSTWDMMKHGAASTAEGVTQHILNAPGIGAPMLSIGNGVRAALGEGPVTKDDALNQMNQSEANFQASRGPDAGKFSWADLAGKMGIGAPLAIAAAPETLAGMAGLGAVNGGLGGLFAPVYGQPGQSSPSDFWKQTGQNTTAGTLAGGLFGPVAGKGAQTIAPHVAPAMQMLIDKGIIPTPGESLGGLGSMTEHLAEKIPFAQGAVTAAKQRAYEQYNRAAVNDTLEPIRGELSRLGLVGADPSAPLTTAPIGGPLLTEMGSKISHVYDNVLNNTRFGSDPQFDADIGNLRDLAQNLNPQQKQKFNTYMDQYLYSKIQPAPGAAPVGGSGQVVPFPVGGSSAPVSPSIDGRTFKNIMGDFAKLSSRTDASGLPEDSQLAAALKSVPLAMKDSLARQNPQAAQSLANVDRAYAMSTQINNAAARAKGNYAENPAAGLYGSDIDNAEAQAAQGLSAGKVFTPQDHLNAIFRNDTSANHGAFARGTALGQQLPMAMQETVGELPKEAGTVSKVGTMALLGSVGEKLLEGGGAEHLPLLAGLGTVGGGLASLYSKPGQYLAHYAGNVRPPGFDMLGAIAKQAALPTTAAYGGEVASTQQDWLKRLQQAYPGALNGVPIQ